MFEIKTNKTMLGVIIALCAVILVGVVVIVVLLNRPANQQTTDTTDNRGTVVTQKNADEVVSEITDTPVEDGYYETSQSIDWHFKDGVSEDAYIENSTDNARTVYFDLIEDESGETIYSSPYIPVGSVIDGLTLDKNLDPGTYETTMIYHLVDDDKNEVSTLSIALTIYVE